MLPDMNTGPTVVHQIMQDRLTRAERQRMLERIPAQKPDRIRMAKRIVRLIGAHMVTVGRWLERTGESSVEYAPMGNEST